MTEKYDELAGRFTAHEYGDPERYFGRRARIVVSLGPPLVPGDAILDLACADGSAAAALGALGLRYLGVDTSEAMVGVARRRGVEAELGDLRAYEPAEPVAATTIFRSLHLVGDRVTFFRRVAGFTQRKLVFDLSPRRYSLGAIRAELVEAGLPRVATRPFLVAQHGRLPAPAAALLAASERTPLARLLLRYRFTLLVAAFRAPSSSKPTTAVTRRESLKP